MAKQKIVWTALPNGRVEEGPQAGQLRVSLVASPRLTPQTAAEQRLNAPGYKDFHNWPKTLEAARFFLRVGAQTVPLDLASKPDAALWDELFPGTTFVEGFVFKDMSRVNLRSFAVRNVVGFLREHYGNLAAQSAGTHPTLLPWAGAHGTLKGMLTDLGTRTQKINLGDRSIEVPVPGFDRFLGDEGAKTERLISGMVFGPDSRYRAPVVGIDGKPQSNQQLAIRVFGVDPSLDDREIALQGIDRLSTFWSDLGAPSRLADYGIGEDALDVLADKAMQDGPFGRLRTLEREDVLEILRMSL